MSSQFHPCREVKAPAMLCLRYPTWQNGNPFDVIVFPLSVQRKKCRYEKCECCAFVLYVPLFICSNCESVIAVAVAVVASNTIIPSTIVRLPAE